MRRPTDTRLHKFQSLDATLVRHVYSIHEQQALRLLAALLLAGYSALQPGALLAPAWISIVAPFGYALLQTLLALIEEARGVRRWQTALIVLLDLALLPLCLYNDPAAAAPTLLFLLLISGLAMLRLSLRGLLLTALAGLALAALALFARHLQQPALPLPPLLANAGTLILLFGLLLVLHKHIRQLRLLNQETLDTDADTGLGNRWTLYAAARLLWPFLHRQQIPTTLMYVVIEPTGLKKGRGPGFSLVRQLDVEFARLAEARLRGSDIMVRYAPLEFVFVLLDCPSSQAEPIALQLQEQFHRWSQAEGIPATAHVGATWLPQEPMALDQLLHSMDEALSRARRHRLGVSGAVYADPEQGRSGTQLS